MAITVKYGDSGTNAKIVQQMLNRHGYNLDVDGIIGDNTLAAIKDYQKNNGLAVDGIVGQNTWSLLAGDTSNVYTTTPANNPNTSGAKKTNASSASASQPFTYKDFTYDDFTYGDYEESDIVKQASAALQAQLAQKPGEYKSQWQTQLDDTINKILNREKFSYDLNGDALYQQYKDKYIQQGKMAMGDAIGQASAMTGGYGNSYAQSVGQQMYQKELQNLNDVSIDLYQMALDKYSREGQELYNQFAMLGERENMDYGRYRDSVADWLTERDYLTGRYDSERDYDYGKYVDDRNFEYGKYSDDRNLAYDKYSNDKSYAYNEYRNAIEDALRREEFDYQKERDRISDQQWQKQYALAEAEAASKYDYGTGGSGGGSGSSGGSGGSGGSGSGGGGGSYDNGGYGDSIVKQAQKYVGASADGKWGADSAAKAKAKGYNSLAEVVAAAGLKGSETTKGYNDFSRDTHDANVKANGGSYYKSTLGDLKQMKANGKSNKEAQAYLEELVGNSIISRSEYYTLYNKYRNNELG